MIGVLWLVGVVATAFAVFTRQALGEATPFVVAHFAVGAAAIVGAIALGLLRIGRIQQPALLAPSLRAVGAGLAASAVAAGVYWLAVQADVRLDWTFEGKFEIADATRKVLAELPAPLTMTLYYDDGDPRIRSTKLLLEGLARAEEQADGAGAAVRVRRLADHPDDEDRYGIGSSNSVVLAVGPRWELVERPTQGALYQALSGMVREHERVLYITVGAGEGDLERTDDAGYSGLRAALESEGFAVRPLPLALAAEIPPDADAVIALAPRRPLTTPGVEALAHYLAGGGRLVAFVEPAAKDSEPSGLERVLAGVGITPLPGFVVDPASGPIEGDAPGRNPVAAAYAEHPVTRGLEANRMTFFRGARTFDLRKVAPGDRLRGLVYTSGAAWIEERPLADAPASALPVPPPGTRRDYLPLVAAAEIERGGATARIVAFGDADLAANHALRALYNLDLVLNAVHWVTEHESAIAIRPKVGGRQLVQFPVPLQTSLQAFYGVGLLVPELLLLAGGWVWLRQREA
jgi:hypothetical protein